MELSKEHGVNPSLIVCPVCGKDIGIALLGKLKGDAKAPMTIKDSELCDDCNKKYITIIEVISESNPKPTGRRVFLERDCLKVHKDALKCVMSSEDFNEMFAEKFNNTDNGINNAKS